MLDQNFLWPGLKANVMLIDLKLVFVVVIFFFLTQVMYANKVETKEKIKIT